MDVTWYLLVDFGFIWSVEGWKCVANGTTLSINALGQNSDEHFESLEILSNDFQFFVRRGWYPPLPLLPPLSPSLSPSPLSLSVFLLDSLRFLWDSLSRSKNSLALFQDLLRIYCKFVADSLRLFETLRESLRLFENLETDLRKNCFNEQRFHQFKLSFKRRSVQ